METTKGTKPATMAKVLQAVRLPGESLADMKVQMEDVTDADKETLVGWLNEQNAAVAV